MRDDQANSLAVGRHELFQTPLELRVFKSLRRQIERVVVLGFVEGLSHGCRVLGHRSLLVVETFRRRIVRQVGLEIVLLAGDLRWYPGARPLASAGSSPVLPGNAASGSGRRFARLSGKPGCCGRSGSPRAW